MAQFTKEDVEATFGGYKQDVQVDAVAVAKEHAAMELLTQDIALKTAIVALTGPDEEPIAMLIRAFEVGLLFGVRLSGAVDRVPAYVGQDDTVDQAHEAETLRDADLVEASI